MTGAALLQYSNAALGCSRRLRTLDLSRNSVGDATAKALGRALAAQLLTGGLRSLSLSHNKIGPAGARRLAEGLRVSTSLEALDLGSNKLGSEGAKLIAAALATERSGTAALPHSLSRLTTLRLSENAIGEEGVAAMLRVGLQANDSLTELGLESNGIGTVGCLSLARWAAERFSPAAPPVDPPTPGGAAAASSSAGSTIRPAAPGSLAAAVASALAAPQQEPAVPAGMSISSSRWLPLALSLERNLSPPATSNSQAEATARAHIGQLVAASQHRPPGGGAWRRRRSEQAGRAFCALGLTPQTAPAGSLPSPSSREGKRRGAQRRRRQRSLSVSSGVVVCECAGARRVSFTLPLFRGFFCCNASSHHHDGS